MNKKYHLGRIGELEIYFQRNIFIGALILLGIFTASASLFLEYDFNKSLFAGALAVIAYYISEYFHQQGHQAAAKKTGYPMEGMLFIWVLAASLYPKDEPTLSSEIHIQRALGGPIRSFLISLIFEIFAWALSPNKNLAYDFFVFISGINLIVFCLGAFLPLGFTDGSTLLEWWPKRSKLKKKCFFLL